MEISRTRVHKPHFIKKSELNGKKKGLLKSLAAENSSEKEGDE